MSIGTSLKRLADRARGRVRPEQAERGIDRAAKKFDQATGGRHGSKVGKAQGKVKGAARRYFGRER